MKLGNQYRGLHADEYDFLSEKMREQRDKERLLKDQDNAEVLEYRECVIPFQRPLSSIQLTRQNSALAKKHAAEVAAAEPKLPSPVSADSAAKADSAATAEAAATAAPKRVPPKSGKKDVKSLMKGVVIKKKGSASTAKQTAKRPIADEKVAEKKRKL